MQALQETPNLCRPLWGKSSISYRSLVTRYSLSSSLPHFLRHKTTSVSSRVLQAMDVEDSLTPLQKGYNYLTDSCNAKRCFQPVVSGYADFRESKKSPFYEFFDTSLILDLLHNKPFDAVTREVCLRYLKDSQGANKLFSFFEDATLLPQDVDDTSLATLNLLRHRKMSRKAAMQVADAIIANVDEKGVIQTYFPPTGGRDGRIDLSVCANAMRLIHQLGRGHEALPTEDYLYSFLDKMRLLNQTGSLYYGNHAFFYFMWDALKISESLNKRFADLFADRVVTSIGSSESPIDLASRIIVTSEMGLSNYMEIDKLYRLQQKDGSWPIDVAYTGSRKNLYWGSKMVTTAFALRALDNDVVTQLNHKMRTLPVLSRGFEVANAYLKYTKDFIPLSFKRRIIVVTHTETLSARDSKFYETDKESPSNSLTEKGKHHAISIAKRLRGGVSTPNVVIFHGENTRTFQTAELLKREFPDVSPACASWLNEINCFDWHGKETQEVIKTSSVAQAMFSQSNSLAQASKGQSFLEFLNGVYEGLLQLQKTEQEKTTILLCTSRVNLVAIKVLTQRDVLYDAYSHIDWSTMARKTETGSFFTL